MKNYIGIDGLVLCVMGGKIDVKRWISSIDMFDHSIISYEELINSVNNLLNGELILRKNNKLVLSKQAKQILRGGWRMGCIEWQLTVQKRICRYFYDETKPRLFDLPQEEYDTALKKYRDETEKTIARLSKY